jgi:hypothetical protein
LKIVGKNLERFWLGHSRKGRSNHGDRRRSASMSLQAIHRPGWPPARDAPPFLHYQKR